MALLVGILFVAGTFSAIERGKVRNDEGIAARRAQAILDAARSYWSEHRAPASSLTELVSAGLISSSVTSNPIGGPFVVSSTTLGDGTVQLMVSTTITLPGTIDSWVRKLKASDGSGTTVYWRSFAPEFSDPAFRYGEEFRAMWN